MTSLLLDFLLPPLLAEEGILYAIEKSTLSGKAILLLLFVASIFSWTVIVTKSSVLRRAKRRTAEFLEEFREERRPLRIYEEQLRFDGAPLYYVYRTGCEELLFQLLGSTTIDETFRARLDNAEKITPAQMRSVQSALERAVGDAALRLEGQLILLATAVSGAPFLGLLGTVWGVLDAFSAVAMAGTANLADMAPGVAGSLVTTVIALCVAIPAMFGYNYLVTSIKAMILQMDNFASELASTLEHHYVNHTPRSSPFVRLS